MADSKPIKRRNLLSGTAKLFMAAWATWVTKESIGSLATRAMASDAKDKPKMGKYLEFMNWKEAELALSSTEVVLIPLGARSKEHGLHLPLNTDWLTAEYLTRRVLDSSPVLALPTLQYGYYPAFKEYAGSINIERDTFRDFIVDICRSIARFGPKKIYILNTGISTKWALEPARSILLKEKIIMEYTGDITADVEKSLATQPAGTHADEIETSVLLYLAPEVVRMDLAKRDIHPDLGPGGLTRDPNAKTGVFSPTGAWGDPTLATREKGKKVTEATVERVVAFIEKMRGKDFAPTPVLEQFVKPPRS